MRGKSCFFSFHKYLAKTGLFSALYFSRFDFLFTFFTFFTFLSFLHTLNVHSMINYIWPFLKKGSLVFRRNIKQTRKTKATAINLLSVQLISRNCNMCLRSITWNKHRYFFMEIRASISQYIKKCGFNGVNRTSKLFRSLIPPYHSPSPCPDRIGEQNLFIKKVLA